MDQDRAASVQTRAYQLWEESGRAGGHDEQHWQQAEREVDAAGPAATAGSSPVDGNVAQEGTLKPSRRVPSPITQS